MNRHTRLCFVLDASGSMIVIQADTQGGFTVFLKKTKETADANRFRFASVQQQ